MKKLRVVHVVEALGGGLYTYFVEMLKVLGSRQDLELFVIYSDQREEVEADRIQRELDHPNVTLIPVSMAASISPIQDARTVKLLSRKLNELAPDVLHLHSSKISVLGRLAYRNCRCTSALFYTPHGYAFLRQDIPHYQRATYKAIEYTIQKTLGGTTVACGDTEYKTAQKLGNARLVRNGISIDDLGKQTHPSCNDKLTVGILGRITHARNPQLFDRLAKSFPDVHFLWIGGGKLRHLLTADNIEVTGWFMDRKKAVAQLARLDIYLQISLWEGLPLAPLEAMSFNLPVVASNVIGNRDIVDHGRSGYLCTHLQEYKKSIETLHDAQLRQKMGDAGRSRLTEKFNAQQNFQDLIELYREFV